MYEVRRKPGHDLAWLLNIPQPVPRLGRLPSRQSNVGHVVSQNISVTLIYLNHTKLK